MSENELESVDGNKTDRRVMDRRSRDLRSSHAVPLFSKRRDADADGHRLGSIEVGQEAPSAKTRAFNGLMRFVTSVRNVLSKSGGLQAGLSGLDQEAGNVVKSLSRVKSTGAEDDLQGRENESSSIASLQTESRPWYSGTPLLGEPRAPSSNGSCAALGEDQSMVDQRVIALMGDNRRKFRSGESVPDLASTPPGMSDTETLDEVCRRIVGGPVYPEGVRVENDEILSPFEFWYAAWFERRGRPCTLVVCKFGRDPTDVSHLYFTSERSQLTIFHGIRRCKRDLDLSRASRKRLEAMCVDMYELDGRNRQMPEVPLHERITNEWLGDDLIRAMRIAGIRTIGEANKFLLSHMKRRNADRQRSAGPAIYHATERGPVSRGIDISSSPPWAHVLRETEYDSRNPRAAEVEKRKNGDGCAITTLKGDSAVGREADASFRSSGRRVLQDNTFIYRNVQYRVNVVSGDLRTERGRVEIWERADGSIRVGPDAQHSVTRVLPIRRSASGRGTAFFPATQFQRRS